MMFLWEVGFVERDCGSCGVEECYVCECMVVIEMVVFVGLYNLDDEFVSMYKRVGYYVDFWRVDFVCVVVVL